MNQKIVFNILIFLFSLGVLVTLFFSASNVRLIIVGVKTDGIVYQMYTRPNPNTRFPGFEENIPLISFFTLSYERYETQGCPECYKIGDKVTVIYDPQNPSNASIDCWSLCEPLYYFVGLFVFLIVFIKLKKLNLKKL